MDQLKAAELPRVSDRTFGAGFFDEEGDGGFFAVGWAAQWRMWRPTRWRGCTAIMYSCFTAKYFHEHLRLDPVRVKADSMLMDADGDEL